MPEPSREEVVIVGMAGRFPGAGSVAALWQNLLDGVESIRPLTDDELIASGTDPALARSAGYVAAGAPLEDADAFDAAFFGYTRRDAEIMDPQHRVVLECAWSALEDAGYDPAAHPAVIGIFGGVAPNTYRQKVLETRPDTMAAAGRYPLLIGSEREYAITRVAFKLGLHGPAISVNTACSTSGVALHLACQSVLSGECDMALAGGARVAVPLTGGYVYEEDGILSPDGHCRAFDADGRGTVVGSGVGFVVVKRLSDALRDGDTIRAVIRGTAVNNDGSDKIGFTAPGVQGQEAVIRQALDMAEVDAATIGYVEAHGTGTFLGDPIEVEALTRAYRRDTDAVGYCRIGSVKTNIGHLDAGAGIAGVIKTVLALESGEIPASLNFATPNPQIDLATSPFRVSGERSAWPDDAQPRRAAVSTFGLGGTNAHLVLEQAPPPLPAVGSGRDHHLFVVSGRTEGSLERTTLALAGHLDRHRDLDAADASATLLGRRAHALRRAVVARDAGEAVQALQEAATRAPADAAAARPVLFMFPGGGAQHVGMGRRLYATEPVFRTWFDRCADLARPLLGEDLRRLVHGHDDGVDLERPGWALPALFTTEYATARLLGSLGVRPDLMIGHSMGEYTAACLAGVMSLDDAMALVARRGELFDTLPPGAMLSVPLPAADLEARLGDDLSIAVINRPDLCTVAGGLDAVAALEGRLAGEGVETRRLHIVVAAHSHLIEPILERFGDFVSTIDLAKPSIPYVSNLTGEVVVPGEISSPRYWVDHLRNTVRFADGLQAALAGEAKLVVEVGPGQVLSGFARQHPARVAGQVVVATLPHPAETTPDDAFFLGAVGRMWVAGAAVDLRALHAGEARRHLPLPTYQFDRVRHWIEPAAVTAPTAPGRPAGEPRASLATPTGVGAVGGTTDDAAAAADEPHGRRRRLVTRVVDVFCDLSGLEPAELDAHATFLELGFDSLFMTQATAALGSAFGMRISFRQLLEEAPTVTALAGWLDDRLPADAFPPASPPSPVAAPAAGAGSALDRIAAQLTALQGQVAALSGGAPAPVSAPPVAVAPTSIADGGASGEAVAPVVPSGPWRPPDRRPDDLDPGQRRHVEALTGRLVSRSPGSKAATAANRPRLADPRTVAGFRRSWKEMVYPIVAERSAGPRLWDVDGNEYLDVAMGFGVNLFGHTPPFVLDAVTAQLARGIEIGPQTPLAGEVAALVGELTGHERVAFCNTGSEAVLAAMRLARTVTGRTKVLTFANDYHGIFDEVLARGVVRNGTRRSIPIARGIPEHAPQDLVIFDYDDPDALRYVAEHAGDLAAVLVEPVQSRHPDLQPVEFLRELRRVTAASAVPLIFDEMITGFRSHPGGAQALFGVKADLATYGKVAGGGFPIGIVAGDATFMDALDGGAWRYGDDSIPEADVTWFAGTFVRHPLTLAASRAALRHLRDAGPALQDELNHRTTDFVSGLNDFLLDRAVPLRIEHFSSLFLFRFERDQQFSSLFYFHLRDQGIHITEGRSAFLSTAHSDGDLEQLDAACRAAVDAMVDGGFLSTGPRPVGPGPQQERPPLPVTDGQQEIWLAAQQGPEVNCAYNLSNTLHITGPVDAGALHRALNRVVARHEALRVTFAADGTSQHIAPELVIDLPLADLSDLSSADADAALARERATDVETAFDLERGPLIRARLIRLSAEDHHLFVTVHHAVCDGWSSGTVLRDLTEIYTDERNGRSPDGPPPMQLTEYVRTFERYRESPDCSADERFWTELVAESFPTTDLPGDRARPAQKTHRADRRTCDLDAGLVGDLRTLAASEGSTLFTLLLGSFECLLARLTGQDEVGLAVSVAGQTRLQDRNLVAHCVSALPLRRRVDLDASFSQHLATTRTAFLDAFEHQDFSYGAIVRSAGVRRDPSRTPLVSVIFNMDAPAEPLDMAGSVAVPGSNPRHFENFDIFVNVVPRDDGLVLECTYNLDLFDADTIDRRLDGWKTLLSGVVAVGGGVLVGGVGVVSVGELGLLAGWGGSVVGGGGGSLVELWGRGVGLGGGVVGVDGVVVSAVEFAGLVAGLVGRLRAVGVGSGSLVGVVAERSLGLVVAVHAVVVAGAGFVPLDPEYPRERLGHMVGETGMGVVVCGAGLAGLVDGLGVVVVEVDGPPVPVAVGAVVEGVGGDAVVGSDVAYVMYTSGSTGRPKGVVVSHGAVANRLVWMQERFGLGADDVVLLKTPFSFDVSVWELFWSLEVGAGLVVAAPGGHRDPAYLVELIVARGVTTVHFVPSMLRLFLESPLVGSCGSLRRVVCSGEALTRDVQARFFEVFPDVELHNLYGPTEAAIDVTAWRCDPADRSGVVPIGAPVANTTIHVLDAGMRPVPVGVPGELHIGGVQVADGYVNRPDLTAERFVADPFDPPGRLYKTGDLARWLPSGQIDFLGRIDTQVKIRGQRVELGEIEATLGEHPTILESAVVLRHDDDGDADLVAYVVARTGRSIDVDDLRRHLKRLLPAHMVPARYVVLDEPPLTSSGKLDRAALPAADRAEVAGAGPSVAPRTDLEGDVAQLWAEVLGLDEVGVETDFFDLGGHSLKLLQVASRIEREYGVRPPLASLFAAPTVAAHAVLVMEALLDDAGNADVLADLLDEPGPDAVVDGD